MNLAQFLLILRARLKIILITFGVTVLTTLVVSLLLPKTYKATTSLVLNYKGIDPVTGLSAPAQLMPGYIATQVDIITSHNVALKVVDNLKFANSPGAQQQFMAATDGKGDIRDWYADLLLPKLDVVPSRESSVLAISFTGSEPAFAAAVANAFASAYQQTSIQLKIEPVQIASNILSAQTKILRENLEKAQTNLSKYQQEKGFTSSFEQSDVEGAKLNELSAQLTAAQAQAIEASSRQTGARANAVESPDVASSPVVQGLKVEISRAEAKLAELSQRVNVNHPQYLSAKAELDNLKSRLQDEIRGTTASVGNSAHIYRQRESELRAQLESQRTRVLDQNRSRDQLTLLQKDVESAQRALDAVNQRYTQTSLESQSNQAEVAILNPAVAPLKATGPQVMRNVLLSVFLGTMFGIGLGLLVEMIVRRVRSRDDIVELLDIPVFAVIRKNVLVKRHFGLFAWPKNLLASAWK